MSDPLLLNFHHVLLVEDNPDDIVLVKKIFRDHQLSERLSVVEDGEAALAFLRRQDPYTHAPIPHLILLDLGLPKKDGRAVLEAVKADPSLSRIPVLIMTSSRAQEDLVKGFELKVDGYIPKPVALDELTVILKRLKPPPSPP